MYNHLAWQKWRNRFPMFIRYSQNSKTGFTIRTLGILEMNLNCLLQNKLHKFQFKCYIYVQIKFQAFLTFTYLNNFVTNNRRNNEQTYLFDSFVYMKKAKRKQWFFFSFPFWCLLLLHLIFLSCMYLKVIQ